MRTDLLAFCLFLSGTLCAQCDQNQLDQQEHGWSHITVARNSEAGKFLAKESSIVQLATQQVINLCPKPKGGEGSWYANFAGSWSLPGQYAKPVSAITTFKNYFCAQGQPKLNGEYQTSVFMEINGLGFLSGNSTLNNKEYRYIHKMAKEQADGFYYDYYWSYHGDNTQESWLLTYPGKKLLIPLTRKEYLTELKAHQTTALAQRLKGISDAAAIADINAGYKKIFDRIDGYLNNSAADYLSQPAVVHNSPDAFYGFEESEKSSDSYYLMKVNPDYFDKQLPVTAPQYITVTIRHNKKMPSQQWFFDAVNKPALFDGLRKMLGK